MNTKFTTGDKVMVPAIIETAREENGKILYSVNTPWEVEEGDIEALPDIAVKNSLRRMIREIGI